LVVVAAGLATGILAGEGSLLVTLLPTALAGAGIAAALLIAPDAETGAQRLQAKHGKLATAITSLTDAVQDTERRLFHHDTPTTLLGLMAYLGLDMLVLRCAFLAIHVHPHPGFPTVMAYITGARG
jgi:hypothetical protein